MLIKKTLKQLVCKHKNCGWRWIYPEDWFYNKMLNKVQTTRFKEGYCKDCGKSFGTVLAQPVFTDYIEEEVKKEYFKNHEEIEEEK